MQILRPGRIAGIVKCANAIACPLDGPNGDYLLVAPRRRLVQPGEQPPNTKKPGQDWVNAADRCRHIYPCEVANGLASAYPGRVAARIAAWRRIWIDQPQRAAGDLDEIIIQSERSSLPDGKARA